MIGSLLCQAIVQKILIFLIRKYLAPLLGLSFALYFQGHTCQVLKELVLQLLGKIWLLLDKSLFLWCQIR
ncbi:hypothetical protein HMPREF2944_08805 [Rothia sp. HMSC072E10]|nr:hypothetical protein HMPREF2944_08805 [Rothia sp. HMSC072E10]